MKTFFVCISLLTFAATARADGYPTYPSHEGEICNCHLNPDTQLPEQLCWSPNPDNELEFAHWTGERCQLSR